MLITKKSADFYCLFGFFVVVFIAFRNSMPFLERQKSAYTTFLRMFAGNQVVFNLYIFA